MANNKPLSKNTQRIREMINTFTDLGIMTYEYVTYPNDPLGMRSKYHITWMK